MNALPNRKSFADAVEVTQQKPAYVQQQQQQPQRSPKEEALRRWQQGPGQSPQM